LETIPLTWAGFIEKARGLSGNLLVATGIGQNKSKAAYLEVLKRTGYHSECGRGVHRYTS